MNVLYLGKIGMRRESASLFDKQGASLFDVEGWERSEITYSEDSHLLQQNFLQVMPGASGDGHHFQNCPHV